MTGGPVLDNPQPSDADTLRGHERDRCDNRRHTGAERSDLGADDDSSTGGGHATVAVERIIASVRPRLPLLARTVAACQECAQAATACVDAYQGEGSGDELPGLVRTLLNAADIAAATARVLSRTGTDRSVRRALLATCWSAARVAREACEESQAFEHRCALTAQACRVVEHACRELLEQAH